MGRKVLLHFLICFYITTAAFGQSKNDYNVYHKTVLKAEQKIASQEYAAALTIYEEVFKAYDFIFRRDYQVASQLAAIIKNKEKTLTYIELGIQAGWTFKSIKKKTVFKQYLTKEDWKTIKGKFPSLRISYENKLNKELMTKVKKMSSKDQWKALKALVRFGEKAQIRYAEKKFAPHSEQQMAILKDILLTQGYPGEKLVGNGVWMSTIISHHNSISTAYNRKDILYPSLMPKLKEALQNGQLSPYQYAIIDDWYLTSLNDTTKPTYGIIRTPSSENVSKTNALRANIHIRSIALRDKLLGIQEKTGMYLYIMDIW